MNPSDPVDRYRGALKVALMAAAAALGAGLVLSLVVPASATAAADAVIMAGLAVLVAIPVLSVIGVLIDEWRRRDWPFAAAAVAVLVVLMFTLLRKMTS